MKTEIIHNLEIPKIGFGTWKIGGETAPDRSRDAQSLAAIRSALELGYTHFDTAEMYAAGHTEEIVGQAIREAGAPREKLFVTSKVKPTNLRYSEVLKSCEASLKRLGMDYLDLYLIHWPSLEIELKDTFRALNKLVRDGKVKNLGVSNFNLKQLNEAQGLSETPIITDQVPYSFSDRSYAKNGVLEYCQQNDILLTAYSPIDVGRLKASAALKSVAEAHNTSTYQIALAWLVSQRRVITIPMSFNPKHQQENLSAADIALTDEEMQMLTK